MRRWDVSHHDDGGVDFEETPEGLWVEYDDAAADRAKLLALLKDVHESYEAQTPYALELAGRVEALLKQEGLL